MSNKVARLVDYCVMIFLGKFRVLNFSIFYRSGKKVILMLCVLLLIGLCMVFRMLVLFLRLVMVKR